MKIRKYFIGLLAASMVITSIGPVFALDMPISKATDNVVEIGKTPPADGPHQEKEEKYFYSFKGVVKEIRDFKGRDGAKFVSVENEDGLPANIIVSDDTYIINDGDITVGSTIVGYYDANAPMIMIYPPQYNARVIYIDEGKAENIKVEKFDNNLVSVDNFLKLNISDETEIVTEMGKSVEGDIGNQKLIVIYGAATKSIPAQTNPYKIILLDDEEDIGMGDLSEKEILVDQEKIDSPAPYLLGEDIIMLPLKNIVAAMGYNVSWNPELREVRVGKGISLNIGKDNYHYMKTAPIKLGAAPEIVDGRTYVPLEFFERVIPASHVEVSEGQIRIEVENNKD